MFIKSIPLINTIILILITSNRESNIEFLIQVSTYKRMWMVWIAGDKLYTMQRVKRRKGLGFNSSNEWWRRDRANGARGRPTCSGRWQQRTNRVRRGGWGTEGNKQGHFKDKSDKAVEEKVIIVDDNNPDPKYWIQYIGEGSNETCIVLYPESKPNILNKEGWNSDSEIHAGLKLLKGQFAFVGGLADPALNGDMVLLETHDPVQVINCGDHCVCISTVPDVQWVL